MSEIDELQRLLLGEQTKEILDDLDDSIRDPEQRARFVSEVLPQALRSAQAQGEHLAGALQAPVTQCIRRSVERDAGMFADVLYPTMGPAIRKSITETLKQFVQSLNQALEHSLSLKGLKWRWEAWRSGVPFAEVVLKNTLLYRVEESYLIQRDSGLMLAHQSARADLSELDQDAVSAMLTAIQDFVRDAFAAGGDSDLETLEMGDRLLWVIRGPKAIMACVIRGIPPARLRERLSRLLDQIHQGYAQALGAFDGDRTALPGIEGLLRDSLECESRESDWRKGFPWPAVLVLFLVVAAGVAITLALTHDPDAPRRQALLQALAAEPGLVILDADVRMDRFSIRGLQDPQSRTALQVAAQSGWQPNELDLKFSPYQSLDPALILPRARALLQPPPEVNLSLQAGVLHLGGRAPPTWVDRVRDGFVPPAGVDRLDLAALEDDQGAMLRQLQGRLEPPQAVDLRLNGRNLEILGSAPYAWLARIEPGLRGLDWLKSCTSGGLQVEEWQQARALQQELARTELFFSDGVSLTGDGQALLSQRLEELARLHAWVETLGLRLLVRVTGHSDGVGNADRNLWLRHQRAELVASHLPRVGLTADQIHTDIEQPFEAATQPDLTRRRVVLEVTLSGEPHLPLVFCR